MTGKATHPIELFIPGRLCLFGEHSDWSVQYRDGIVCPGKAIVTGIDQGIYAYVESHTGIRFRSVGLKEGCAQWVHFPLNADILQLEALNGSLYSYVAGTILFMYKTYGVGGILIDCKKVTLPIGKGLSSSAAICILVVRAYNRVYGLGLSIEEEMEAAYQGEAIAASQCGRMDQALAYGKRPILLTFNGHNVQMEPLEIHSDFHFVIADINGKKNTRRILNALNINCSNPQSKAQWRVHRALGEENLRMVQHAASAIQQGDAFRLGQLMVEAQKVFDELVAPACPEELGAPILHTILSHPEVKRLALGGKGVGSQGDGTAQFICGDKNHQSALLQLLRDLGCIVYPLDIRAEDKGMCPRAEGACLPAGWNKNPIANFI